MSAAASVEPFLKEYQTDAPMVPFLFTGLIGLNKSVMDKAMKVNVKFLIDLEITDKNLLPSSHVDIGFAALKAENMLGKLSEQKLLLFRNDCRAYYKGFLEKFLERSPLRYPVTRFLTCLNPEVILTSVDVAKKHLDLCLETFVEKEHLSGNVVDNAKAEFAKVCGQPSFKNSLSTFRRHDRLDGFWCKVLSESDKEYVHLMSVVKKIMILSHGNATVERGFSVNKQCLVSREPS